jgi:cell division protein FtsW
MTGFLVIKHDAARKVANRRTEQSPHLDYYLLGAILTLIGLGLVMVGSASISIADRQLDQPFYYLNRQLLYVATGLVLAAVVMYLPLDFWQKTGPVLLMFGAVLLILVLIPAIGREVNGSARWLGLGPARLQPSELMKLFMVIYLAGYMVRHAEALPNSFMSFLKPMALLALLALLLLAEPDFGAAAVMVVTALGMLFLGGVRLWQFGILLAGALAASAALAFSSPYRMERLTTFINPWADPYNSGFQLTQALIAFGRGEWLGVGLGGSIQKLFYLPEAHTDFVFAVLAEELGLIGTVTVILLFGFIVLRIFFIGVAAEKSGNQFAGYLAHGLGLWIGLQAVINMGVNMGMLPTKGLTLPLMSYGGTSVVVTCIALALVLRIDWETAVHKRKHR